MAIGLPIGLPSASSRAEHVAFGRKCRTWSSVTCQRPGASEPAFMLTLVQARTQTGKAWPQHTVRAANAGRGRTNLIARGHRPQATCGDPLPQQPVPATLAGEQTDSWGSYKQHG